MRNPHVDKSAVAPASCCPVRRAEDQYLEVLVLVVCGRRSFEAWRWHRKSDIENQAELGSRPLEVDPEWLGLVQTAHARLAADPPSVSSRD